MGHIPWNKGKKCPQLCGRKKSPEEIEKVRRANIGRKHSEETKRRWSITRKGSIPWNKGIPCRVETKQKLSKIKKGVPRPWMRGRHVSDETKRKLSQFNKGKKLSEETCRKRSLISMGANNNFWKGGITKLNFLLRSLKKYEMWRMAVFKRDNYKCLRCGMNGYLHAHHIKQFALILKENNIKNTNDALVCNELWDINNGETLCRMCHKKEKIMLEFKLS